MRKTQHRRVKNSSARKNIISVTVFVLAVTAIIAAAPVNLYAAEYKERDSEVAGEIIGEVFDLIMDEYMGGEVTLEELYDAALRGIQTELDPYSLYLNEEELKRLADEMSGGFWGAGMTFQLNSAGLPEIERVFEDSPAEKAGLTKGDIITAVNGQSTEGKTLRETANFILDPAVDTAELQVLRGKKNINFKLEKDYIELATVYIDTIENMTGKPADIGYVNLSGFTETSAGDLRAALEELKDQGYEKLIIDLRGNTGGLLEAAEDICNLLVPEGIIYSTVDKYGNENIGYSKLKAVPFSDTVLLVDGYSASASELFSAAMQDAKAAVLVGQTTFGKGVAQITRLLPTGGAYHFTSMEFFRRSGEKVNGIGVTPDYIVDTDPRDYNTQNDKMLFKAVEILEEK